MKKTMNIFCNDGYVFNAKTQCLDKFTIIKINANFHKGTIEYDCMLGGKPTLLDGEHIELYNTELDFKDGKRVEKPSVFSGFAYTFNRVFGCNVKWTDDEPTSYAFVNGQAKLIAVPDITFTIERDGSSWEVSSDCDMEFYDSISAVYEWNDYDMKDENGEVVHRKSTATLLAMDDEQKSLLKELQDVLTRLNDAEVKLLFDYDAWKIKALSLKNVECLEVWGDYNDSYTEVADGMMVDIKSAPFRGCNLYEYSPHVTFKSETPNK
jgi:hypothetical protein